SSPEECARDCRDNGEPKDCYYHFHIEFYTTEGPACNSSAFLDQCIIGDGFEKTLIPINRQLPGPLIKVCVNDRIIVDVENAAPGNEVTMHWHGIFQNGYQYYDGVPYVTQCPIPSSSTFRVENSGTHFYHSHVSTHMLDGQYGGLIVRDPPSKDPHYQLFDKDEIIIFLSDWMHELSLERFPGRYKHDITQAAQNILINGLGQARDPVNIAAGQITNGLLTEYTVKKGERHRIRLINSFTTVCLAELRIEQHELVVIAQDGANVKPKPVDKIITAAGERVDFILTANQDVDSYWIQVLGLGECNQTQRIQQFAILQYEGGPNWPTRPQPSYEDGENAKGVTYNPLESNCDASNTDVCVNQLEGIDVDPDLLNVEPDERHILPFWFFNYTEYGNGKLFGSTNKYPTFFEPDEYSELISTFNEIAFENPASPLLTQPRSYQTICKKNVQNSCTEPCTCTQVIRTKLDNIVELIIYDAAPLTDLHHPFHLHGYEFKVFTVGQFLPSKNISRADIDKVIKNHIQRLQNGEYENPPGKDTVKIPMGGYAIIRFKANNPGWWLLHCHFTWHHLTGMELVIQVGDRSDLPPVPFNFPECSNWTPALHILNNFYGFRYPQ
ncbi:unnamed protein product, partial [Heterotrigona itama]